MSVADLAAARRTRPLYWDWAGNVDGAMDLFIGRDAMVCPADSEATFGREQQTLPEVCFDSSSEPTASS